MVFVYISIFIIVLSGIMFFLVDGKIRSGIGGIFTAVLPCAFLCFFAMMVTSDIQSKPYPVRHDLKALQDNNSVSGSFFLGIGSIHGDMKYAFYEEQKNGGYALETVEPSGDVTVFEDAPAGQAYEVTYSCRKTGNLWSLLPPIDCGDADWKTEFHVPAGTIQQNYNLDAK